MEKLRSLEEYKALLAQYKQICRRGYSNNFLGIDAVKRYIDLQRIYYKVDEGVLMFFTDEGKYYRLYVQMSPEADFIAPKAEKPILIRNIYKENKKTEVLLDFEKKLQQQGFSLYDETVQIVANPLEMKESLQEKYEKAASFLTRVGLRIDYAKEEHIDEIIALREKEPLLKDYHFVYETEDEIRENVRNRYYRCVFNERNEVCAAQQFSIENGTVQGNWLAVKEEYKVRYGIGTAMAYHSFLYAAGLEIQKYFGWVVRDNAKSIKYHQAIGYEITDKYADEWVL